MIPAAFSEQYSAVRQQAAAVARADRGLIVVSGRDRAAYLHGLLTNDISALKAGQGCYSAYLTPQGRMITDLWVYELGDVILISLGIGEKDALLAKLDQFIFSEDVSLGDVTATFASVVVLGPKAASVVGLAIDDVTAEQLGGLAEHGNLRAGFKSGAAIVLQVSDLGEPGLEVLVEHAHREALFAALSAAGAKTIDGAVAQTRRIEEGVPKFPDDMDHETIPLEAGIEGRAISLTKGCYVGQEVNNRILHRGHGRVAKKLVGLIFEDGAAPTPRSAVMADGKEVGETRSSTVSSALSRPIALAYLHRDWINPGTAVTVGERAAHVAALPFSG